jgi:hypothetical protein
MALALDIMKGGHSAFGARAINGQVKNSLTAAGTTITTALDLTASINVITTCAASAGVQLPNCEIGDEVEILNLGANACAVYPDTAANQINAIAAGGSFALAPNTAVKVRKYTSARWMAYLSA